MRDPKQYFVPVYSFPEIIEIGEIKYDGYRKNHQWTALMKNVGTFGGEEFFARVGDFETYVLAEDALRKEEKRRLKLCRKK